MNDNDVRLGMRVLLPEQDGVMDAGHVTEWDGGWFVRLIKDGELTGPWPACDLTI